MIQTATLQADSMGRIRTPISIQRLLEWAFASECASIDFEDAGTLAQGYRSVGSEWLLMQRCIVGCSVDGGGRSEPAPDADLVASAVAVLPEGCGGRRMAVQVAELARSRSTPEAYVGVIQRYEPEAWHTNRHGKHAKTMSLGTEVVFGGRKPKRHDVRYCPMRLVPASNQIASARRNYLLWWSALLEIKNTFQFQNDMSRWSVTDKMPPMMPWKKTLAE